MEHVALATIVVIFFIILFSQFGKRINATFALGWYAVASIVIIGAVYPVGLEPITALLGIETVSNFILFASLFFLFYFVLDLSISQSQFERKVKLSISTRAARAWQERRNQPKGIEAFVILPCFNEEQSIPGLLTRLNKLKETNSIDFCFIDDGSTDESRTLLSNIAPNNHVCHAMNVGVSGALATGIMIAKANKIPLLINCDGDGQHPIEAIPELIAAARTHSSSLLIGSRFASEKTRYSTAGTSYSRVVGISIIRTFMWIIFPGKMVYDVTSGFRCYSSKSFDTLLADLPDEYPEPESIALLQARKHTIRETYIAMTARETGTSTLGGFRSARYMCRLLISLLGLRLRVLLNHRIEL